MARVAMPQTTEIFDTPGGNQIGSTLEYLKLSKGMGKAALELRNAVYSNHGLSPRLFEACRMRIAQINGCQICQRFRLPEGPEAGVTEDFYAEVENFRTSKLFDERERLAIEYTEKFALDHFSITDEFFDKLHALFTDEEIMNITISVARNLGFGRLTMLLQLDSECSIADSRPPVAVAAA